MDDEKLKNLLQPYKHLNKNRLDNYKNAAPLLTTEFKKKVAALSRVAIKAHPLHTPRRVKKQTIKKTKLGPTSNFLLVIYEALVKKNPGMKITFQFVRREIENHHDRYLDEYFLDVEIEDDFFEIVTAKTPTTTRLTRLGWASLPSTLTRIKRNLTLKSKIKQKT